MRKQDWMHLILVFKSKAAGFHLQARELWGGRALGRRGGDGQSHRPPPAQGEHQRLRKGALPHSRGDLLDLMEEQFSLYTHQSPTDLLFSYYLLLPPLLFPYQTTIYQVKHSKTKG